MTWREGDIIRFANPILIYAYIINGQLYEAPISASIHVPVDERPGDRWLAVVNRMDYRGIMVVAISEEKFGLPLRVNCPSIDHAIMGVLLDMEL